MDPKIVMGIVTRQRPEQLRRCITSALATCGLPLRFAIGFDDDYWGYNQCPQFAAVTKEFLVPRHYYVRGKNAVYDIARDMAGDEAEYFVLSNDDSEWLCPGWGQRAVELLESAFPDGQGCLELFSAGHLAHFIARFDFLDSFTGGVIADPRYTMYFSDTHLRNLLIEQDKYKNINLKGNMIDQYHARVVMHQLSVTGDHLAFEVQSAWWDVDEKVYNSIWTDDGKRVKPSDDGTTVPTT